MNKQEFIGKVKDMLAMNAVYPEIKEDLDSVIQQSIADHEENVKPITDHELSIIAHEWHKNLDTHFIGHKFAFAHGYREAERRLLPAPYQPKEGGKR